MQTGFVYDPVFERHRAPAPHPECPERLQAVLAGFRTFGLSPQLLHLPITPTSDEWILCAHTREHMERVRATRGSAGSYLDPDTYTNAHSYDAACKAVDAVLAAVDAVVKGAVQRVFCAVRPPGHHAERNRAMGFCLFNNIAIGARYARLRHKLHRVFILDWDVHHGNGTQDIFYEDPSVFFCSLHQFPLYPGTGTRRETGRGAGEGYTLNVPLPPGSGDETYVRFFEDELGATIRRFSPDLIMISAGFDAHRDDPLANMELTTEGFVRLTRIVTGLADEVCGGRIVSVLEGGYGLEALAACAAGHVRALTGTG